MLRLGGLCLALLVGCGGASTATPAVDAPEPEPKAAPVDEGAAKADKGWDAFGDAAQQGESVTVAKLLDDPSSFVGKPLAVEGRVADVCQKAGCWMVVTDGARNMRVRMKDHGFSVAKDGAGRDCRVHGEVVEIAVDPETVAHFKSESAKPEVMPEAALAEDAKVTYELVASAVQLKR